MANEMTVIPFAIVENGAKYFKFRIYDQQKKEREFEWHLKSQKVHYFVHDLPS